MAKTIVVTGASDGIGAAAARQLHEDGHTVVVVGRSPDKTRQVAESIGADYEVADFADLRTVRRLAAKLAQRYPRIDVLANNAGGVFGTRDKTADGFEKTFQVNHLAPFLLTTLLLPTLLTAMRPSFRPPASPPAFTANLTSTISTTIAATRPTRHTVTRSSQTSCSPGNLTRAINRWV